MNFRREIYYQENHGKPHKKVTKEELVKLIGMTLSSRLLSKAEYRIEKHPELGVLPVEKAMEFEAFLNGDLASMVIIADWTNRGNIFVQLISE